MGVRGYALKESACVCVCMRHRNIYIYIMNGSSVYYILQVLYIM